MVCGGEVTVFVEPYQPPRRCSSSVVGTLGGRWPRWPGWLALVCSGRCAPGAATVPQFDPAAITPDLRGDHHRNPHCRPAGVAPVLDTPAAYVGMIGSRRKIGPSFTTCKPREYLWNGYPASVPRSSGSGGRQRRDRCGHLAEIVQVRCGGTGNPGDGHCCRIKGMS